MLVSPPLPPEEQDWLCPQCVAAGLCIIEAVKGKRTWRGKIQYLVSYVGNEPDRYEEYQNLRTIPHVVKLMRQYNRSAAQ